MTDWISLVPRGEATGWISLVPRGEATGWISLIPRGEATGWIYDLWKIRLVALHSFLGMFTRI